MNLRWSFSASLDPLLDFTNAGQIFIQLAAVGGAEILNQSLRPVVHDIQNALALRGATRPGFRSGGEIVIAEQALKDNPRIGLGRHRRLRATPGNAVRVRAAIPGIADADGPRILAPEFERGTARC